MNRPRRVMLTLAGGLVLPAGWLRAQDSRPKRLGVLSQLPRTHLAAKPFWESLLGHMKALGWDEGRNLQIEHRFGDLDHARLVGGAQQLVAAGVDVIYTPDDRSTFAAWTATKTVPIVMSSAAAVELGYARSLARPGGNVTGFAWQVLDMVGKEWSLLRAMSPGLRRVGIPTTLGDPPLTDLWVRTWGEVAARQGAAVTVLPDVLKPDDLEPMFAVAEAKAVQALVWPTRYFLVGAGIQRINAWAIDRRVLVSAGWARPHVLLSYGWQADEARIAFKHIDRVLRGTPPAEIPIEQPTRFDLVVNLKIAQAMGLTVPQEVLVQATEVIE